MSAWQFLQLCGSEKTGWLFFALHFVLTEEQWEFR